MQKEAGEQKYTGFIKWFLQNGGYMRDIKYDRFQPTNYLGIAAARDIKKNTIIMAVPKSMIIGIDKVKNSQLGPIIQANAIFQGENNDDKDFNILTLFIIMEKMKGKNSFYSPYLDCIDIAQTFINWTNEQICQISDPYLNINFVNEIRADFQPTFLIFRSIVLNHPLIFKQTLTRELFDFCYGIVMTRCFGWGLPETMLVPFADFLNHNSYGVHHYAFSMTLEGRNNDQYIKKSNCLDLSIFGKDNIAQLPIDYQKDSRQRYLQQNNDVLIKQGVKIEEDVRRLNNSHQRQLISIIRSDKIKKSFSCQLLLSSDSQDNDSLEEQDYDKLIQNLQVKQNPKVNQFYEYKQYFKRLNHLIDARKDVRYIEPKPSINQEFEDDVSFGWWFDVQDSHFIVATSQNVTKGEQIYNSYGRRNNRFLLLWYGFTFYPNKYDSIAFRLWSKRVQKQTGKIIFTRYLTEKDWKNRIPIGNQRYPYTQLSQQFRLKLTELNYYLIAYLRFRKIMDNPKYKEYQSNNRNVSSICDISLEIQVISTYSEIIQLLESQYRMEGGQIEALSSHRKCFIDILKRSNRQIIEAHRKGVEHILCLLNKLKNQSYTRQALDNLYEESWEWEINKSESDKQANHIFVKHYYNQLLHYICR